MKWNYYLLFKFFRIYLLINFCYGFEYFPCLCDSAFWYEPSRRFRYKTLKNNIVYTATLWWYFDYYWCHILHYVVYNYENICCNLAVIYENLIFYNLYLWTITSRVSQDWSSSTVHINPMHTHTHTHTHT